MFSCRVDGAGIRRAADGIRLEVQRHLLGGRAGRRIVASDWRRVLVRDAFEILHGQGVPASTRIGKRPCSAGDQIRSACSGERHRWR